MNIFDRNAENPHRFPHGMSHGLTVALNEPEIPLNVGSIARTCAVTNTALYLVGRVGFILDDRLAKRAGLDYWEHADVHVQPRWDDFMSEMVARRVFFFSTRGSICIWDAEFKKNDILVFGSERTGLPRSILDSGIGDVITIPMVEGFRSLNLANTVSIAVYEALRQIHDRC